MKTWIKVETSILLSTVLLIIPASLRAQVDCGNPDKANTPECQGCNNTGNSGGKNPINIINGSVARKITDLKVSGAVGALPFDFTRTTTSRYMAGVPLPLGSAGSWRHNWY
jgi:hypothetical protein